MRYRTDIDGLRALAVMLVLIFHFDLTAGGKSGFIGVDVFFVISGYLITSIIKNQLDDDSFNLKVFYLKRIRRLAPSLTAILLLVMTAGATWLFPSDFIELSRQVLYSQFYIANFYFWQNINYFGLKADNIFLLHTWSLAVEEQFYLFYPLALIIIHRHLKKYFWSILFLGLIVSFSLNMFFVTIKPEATFYLFPTRAWELLIGGLIPFINSKFIRSNAIDQLLGIAGLILIFLAVFLFDDEVRFPGYFALLPTVGAACLILAGVNRETAVSKILSLPPIVYIGKISYSLYLVHWPINVFATLQLQGNYSLSWRLAMFTLSIVLSAVIYHLIENPFRHKRVFATGKQLARGYLTVLMATATIFAIIEFTDGIPERFPDDVVRLANFTNDKTPLLDECQFHDRDLSKVNDYCTVGMPGKNPQWLIYGDSHAWAAHSAIDKWLKKNDQSGLFVFQHACPPLIGIHLFRDKGNCFNFNTKIANFVKSQPDIKNVFLISIWRQALGGLSTSFDIKPTSEESIALFGKQFSSTVKYFSNIDKNVFVWEPVPGAKGSVPNIMAQDTLTNQHSDIRFSKDEYLSEYGFFFKALNQNADLIEQSFSPSKALCNTQYCNVVIDGKPAYFDGNHMTRSTAYFWVEQLLRQFSRITSKPM